MKIRYKNQIYVLAKEKEEGSLVLWHGGNLDSNEDMIAHKGGRWEFGPGLYLTTHYDTARKYSKGSRKLYRVKVKKGTNLKDIDLPLSEVMEFVDTWVIKSKRKDVKERINNRAKNEKIEGDIFLNIMINEFAIKNTDTDKLRAFLVQRGVDYSIQDNAFGWNERMIVLFNMGNIISKTVVSPKEKLDVFDLPTEFKATANYNVYLEKAKKLAEEMLNLLDIESSYTIYLIGSRASNKAKESSDWDFLIVGEDFDAVEEERIAMFEEGTLPKSLALDQDPKTRGKAVDVIFSSKSPKPPYIKMFSK